MVLTAKIFHHAPLEHHHDTRAPAPACRQRELTENLSDEGKALYATLTSAAEGVHQRQKKDLEEIIIAAVGHAVDAAVAKFVPLAVDKALGSVVNDLQAYTDGAEQELHKQISELRASISLASHSGTGAGGHTRSRARRIPAPMGIAAIRLHEGQDMGHLCPTFRLRLEVSPTRLHPPHLLV